MPSSRTRLEFAPGFLPLAGIVLAVLYAAAAQNNGAAYILDFSLLGLFAVGTVHAKRNLSGLAVRLLGASDGCAGAPHPELAGTVEVRVCLHNDAGTVRYGLWVTPADAGTPEPTRAFVAAVAPGTLREAVLHLEGLPRGRYRIAALSLGSLYPFGFLRAVRPVAVDPCEFWVYPEPVRAGELPAGRSALTGSGGHGAGGDDFVGVRNHQPGESHRHVDWKAVSRGHPKMVKQFGGGADETTILDWELLDGDVEMRLSTLCFWALELEREGACYGLRLPNITLAPGNGAGHLQAALRLLASFGRTES